METCFPVTRLAGRDDFVFISALPWIAFTGIDHTASGRPGGAIPRISWGKFRTENSRILLPCNIQVNHLFVDGIHVGRCVNALESTINSL